MSKDTVQFINNLSIMHARSAYGTSSPQQRSSRHLLRMFLRDPENAWDLKRIEQAATLGGASDYVAKLPKKWNEILYPVDTNYSSQYPIPPGPMKDVMAKVEKQSDLSGMFFFCSNETKILILNA